MLAKMDILIDFKCVYHIHVNVLCISSTYSIIKYDTYIHVLQYYYCTSVCVGYMLQSFILHSSLVDNYYNILIIIRFSPTSLSLCAGVINLASRVTSTEATPTNHTPTPTKDGSLHHHNGERPERMREWLVRMIDSGRFLGLEWLDHELAIFKVPWVHAKKRDYNQERDAALFKEWAIHSGTCIWCTYMYVYYSYSFLFTFAFCKERKKLHKYYI